MSHGLFTRSLSARFTTRPRVLHQLQSGYHQATTQKTPIGSQQLQTLIRQTTLRASTLAAQRLPYTTISPHQYDTRQLQRARSSSPPPPYEVRNTTLTAASGQWTRFYTSTTLSSIRTFSYISRRPGPVDPGVRNETLSPETRGKVDDAIEKISELYGTAKDEFEIASEETEKNSTYASDDREAAREELDKLLHCYSRIIHGEDITLAAEVERRVGQRIRELENAVLAMENAATDRN